MSQFPFVGSSYSSRAKRMDAQRTINMYVEMGGPSSKTPTALIGTPGLRLWGTYAGGRIRGMLRFSKQYSVIVAGANVYRVTTDGAGTLIGTIAAGTTPVCMATNGLNVMLAAGATGYVVDVTVGAVTLITNVAFLGADKVDYIDGYYVFNQPGTGKFQITGLYNTTIDPLDFATAEGSPDLLLSLIVDHREVWLFGEKSTEVFFNSGNVDFPFERIQGAFIETGCAAANSVAKADNSVFWLSADDKGQGMVLRATGYQPQRVSDHGFETAVAKYSRIDDATAFAYQQEGHTFYQINFPTANATWVYDIATNEWHERMWRDPVDGLMNRHRADTLMSFAGETLVGDWENGNVYAYDLDTYSDNGDPLPRIRQCPHLSDADYRMQFFSWLTVDMLTGVGLESGQGSDPTVVLEFSDDNGDTWSNQVTASIGKMGERLTRAKFRRLGKSRDRIFRVTVSDPVRVEFVGASVGVKVGMS